MKKITMKLEKGKPPRIAVEGVCGEGCKDMTRPFEEALGTVESSTNTEEFYAVEVEQQEVTQ